MCTNSVEPERGAIRRVGAFCNPPKSACMGSGGWGVEESWPRVAKPWEHRLYHITSWKLNWSHRWDEMDFFFFFLKKRQFTKLTLEDIESLNRPISSIRNREHLQTYFLPPPENHQDQVLLWYKFLLIMKGYSVFCFVLVFGFWCFFFWLHPQHVGVPRPGIELMPQHQLAAVTMACP